MPILRYTRILKIQVQLISIDGVDGYLAEMYDDVPARNDNFVFRLWEETRSWESPWNRSIYFFFFDRELLLAILSLSLLFVMDYVGREERLRFIKTRQTRDSFPTIQIPLKVYEFKSWRG